MLLIARLAITRALLWEAKSGGHLHASITTAALGRLRAGKEAVGACLVYEGHDICRTDEMLYTRL